MVGYWESFCIEKIEIDKYSFTCAGMLKNGERERHKKRERERESERERERESERERERERDIYICCGVIIWAKFGLLRCYYLGQVFFTTHCLSKKHCNNRGFSTFKKLRAQIWGVIIWAKLAIFKLQSTWPRKWHLLGPDNNTSKWIFFKFLLLKMCRNTYFIVLLNISQNWAKKGQTKR